MQNFWLWTPSFVVASAPTPYSHDLCRYSLTSFLQTLVLSKTLDIPLAAPKSCIWNICLSSCLPWPSAILWDPRTIIWLIYCTIRQMLLQQYKMRWKHSEHRPTILHGKVVVRVLKAAHSSIMDVHSLSILNLVCRNTWPKANIT